MNFKFSDLAKLIFRIHVDLPVSSSKLEHQGHQSSSRSQESKIFSFDYRTWINLWMRSRLQIIEKSELTSVSFPHSPGIYDVLGGWHVTQRLSSCKKCIRSLKLAHGCSTVLSRSCGDSKKWFLTKYFWKSEDGYSVWLLPNTEQKHSFCFPCTRCFVVLNGKHLSLFGDNCINMLKLNAILTKIVILQFD